MNVSTVKRFGKKILLPPCGLEKNFEKYSRLRNKNREQQQGKERNLNADCDSHIEIVEEMVTQSTSEKRNGSSFTWSLE